VRKRKGEEENGRERLGEVDRGEEGYFNLQLNTEMREQEQH
jgi:hypothetical protein